MSLSKITSIDEATDRELLLIILSTQLQITRRIEFLESDITEKEFGSVPEMCDDITKKLDSFAKHLNEAIKHNNE